MQQAVRTRVSAPPGHLPPGESRSRQRDRDLGYRGNRAVRVVRQTCDQINVPAEDLQPVVGPIGVEPGENTRPAGRL